MTTRGGTSFTTTAPAPMNASSPISTAGQSTAPAPTRAPRLMVGPLRSACRFSVRPMKLSFEVITLGAMNTLSSRVEWAVMYASAWIFVSAPDGRVVLDERAAPDDYVVADVATFPDARLVADDDPRAEVRAGEDDRARGDDRPRPELDRRQLLPLRRRARPQRRLLADHRVVEDLAAFTEHGPGIDDRCLGDVDAHPVSGGDCFE